MLACPCGWTRNGSCSCAWHPEDCACARRPENCACPCHEGDLPLLVDLWEAIWERWERMPPRLVVWHGLGCQALGAFLSRGAA